MNSNKPADNRFDLKPLRQFFFSYGHLHVPDSPAYEALFDLCNKLRVSRSILPELTVSELDSMKFNWGKKTAALWHERYNELKKFKQRTGRFPRRKDKEYASLVNWAINQKMFKKGGKLSSERIELLNSIHFNWEKKILGEEWNNNYNSFIDYKKKFGTATVAVKFKKLRGWVIGQRSLKVEKKLHDEKIKLLNEAGFIWDGAAHQRESREKEWLKMYAKLKNFMQKRRAGQGQLDTPDKKLRQWILCQYGERRVGRLSQKKTELLNKVGFVWNKRRDPWDKMYDRLARYKKKYSSTDVMRHDKKLNNWVEYQRLNKSNLSSLQIRLLNKIGFSWNKEEVYQNYWLKMYARLKEYKKVHNTLIVHRRHDKKLLVWVYLQKKFQDKLPEKRRKLLERIGFSWVKTERIQNNWMKMYARLKEYKKVHNTLIVHRRHDKNLNGWVYYQKTVKGKLSEKQLELLDRIGFSWSVRSFRRPIPLT